MKIFRFLLFLLIFLPCNAFAQTVCYTNGTFDMFHIGHLNILKRSKTELKCDVLIVGVIPDDVVLINKNKLPIIPFEQRLIIIDSIKYVDKAIEEKTYNDYNEEIFEKYKINKFIIGDDYKGKLNWQEKKAKEKYNIDYIYLPRTQGQSSSDIRAKLNNNEKKK